MPVFKQGAMDSLCAAKAAIDRAINAYLYGKCTGRELSTDDGPLFEANDNLDTATAEIQAFRDIANNTPPAKGSKRQ